MTHTVPTPATIATSRLLVRHIAIAVAATAQAPGIPSSAIAGATSEISTAPGSYENPIAIRGEIVTRPNNQYPPALQA